MTPGGPNVTVSTTTPGQNARLTFAGTANQRVSLDMSWTARWAQASIISPDGSYLVNPTWANGGGFFGPMVLPATGTYTIVIDPENTNTGSLTLHLYDVPPDATSSIVPGGPNVSVSTTTPGQNAGLTFSGSANQRVSLDMSWTAGWAQASIIKPDGSYLINPTWANGGGFFDAQVLPATGTYTIVIDPENTNTGSMTLHLNDVPPDPVSTITPGGPSVTASTTTPGQNARLTFAGTANQTISLNMGSGTMGWAQVSIVKPDGSYLVGPTWINGGGSFGAIALPVDGTYTVVIDPENANTGSLNVSVTTP
jgi:hypothetical protein